jgi:hypothetical protein
MEHASLFSAIAGNQKIDAEAGVISGCSVITVGECAGKHKGSWVDQKTLTQLLSLASGFKDGVKVKLSESREHDGSAGQIIGSLKNFRIDGDNLRADLHLLKSDSNFGKLIEMSAKMPEAFGLSVVVPNNYETQGKKKLLRPTDIFSIDIVESPAANPTGLFSAKKSMSEEKDKEIKYAEGDSGEHDKSCECKACMARHSKKMSAEDLAAITTQLSAALKPLVEAQTASLSAKLTEHETKLAAYEKGNAAAALSAKKTEIAGLVADAAREGKVVPLTDEQLLTMDVPVIKDMFSKLIPNQVKLSGKRQITPPTGTDGKPVKFENPDQRAEFFAQKKAEGAAQLTAQFLADPSLGLTRN